MGKTMPPSMVYDLYNPDLQGVLDGRCRTIAVLTIRKDVPTLKDIAEAYDNDDVAIEWIKIQLEKVNTFTNVRDKLNIEQLYDIGVQILNCYDKLNVLEFSLFCGRLRHGTYEKFFGSVDPMKILMSLDIFMKERSRDWNMYVDEAYKQRKEKENRESKPVSHDALISQNPGKYPELERLSRITSKLKKT